MKDNKFFELFNDIDSKFIHEAQEKTYEESTAEAMTPQPAPKRKIYPTVLKTAACLAAVGIAAGGLITLGHGTPNILSPNGSGQFAPEASETSDTSDASEPTDETSPDNEDITDGSSSDTPETSADAADAPQNSDITETEPTAETADPTLNEYGGGNTEDHEKEIQREQAVNEWNSREFVSPIGDLPLPDGYSANIDWNKAGYKSIFIPVEDKQAEIRAVSDGEIVYAGQAIYNVGYFDPNDNRHKRGGRMVIIKHNDYVYTVYDAIEISKNIKAGDKVTKGQVIGSIDNGILYYVDPEAQLEPGGLCLNEVVHGFSFDVRTAPLDENEIDVEGILRSWGYEYEDEGNGEAEVGDHETDYVFMEKDGATVTDSGEFIGTVTEAEQINEPYEDDFKV